MLALWVGTFALTVCPSLHQLLHADSQSASHVCLITQIKHHPLLASFVPVAAPLPTVSAVEPAGPAILQPPRGCDYLTSPSRAPPAPFSSRPVVG